MRPSEKPTDRDPIGSAVAASRITKMGTHEISYMLASIARIPLVFMAAATRLTTELFTSDEAIYVLTWRAVTAAAESAGGLLPGDAGAAKQLISLYADREIASDTKRLYYTHKVESAVLDDGGLLDEMYALPLTAEIHATAMDLLVRFTTERKAMDPLRHALAGLRENETIKDLPALMSVIEGHARDIAGLANDPGSDAVVDVDEFTPPVPLLVTTGQKWLDTLLGGGQAKKEAYVILGPSGGGKCFAIGTKVMMFDGSTKAVEDVAVGDMVMGPDSKPRRVLSLARGREPMYEVRGVDGTKYTVNESHTLSLKMTPDKTVRTHTVVNVEVKDYFKKSKTFRSRSKGYRVGVDFQERSIPLDPYFLGLWLADGSVGKPEVTKPDPEVHQYLQYMAALNGLTLYDRSGVNKSCPTWAFSSGRTGGKPNVITESLRSAGVAGRKHVPDPYRFNSRSVRLRLLAGLLDGDGSLKHHGAGYEFSSVSAELAEGVVWLARSLGLAATSVSRVTTCQTGATCDSFRVQISGDCTVIPCIIERKKAQPRRQIKDVLVYGIDVVPVGEGDYYGFEVDGDHLFLLADFSVTHNSALGVQVAVDGAELQASLASDVGAGEAGHWYIFTWELNSDQLRERVYSYGARISRNTFKNVDPRTRRPAFSASDRPDTLHSYELEAFVNSPGNPTTGEMDRMRSFRKRLAGPNSRLHLVDYSGQITGTGAGGIREVVSYLRMEMTKGRRVAGVVFDYAGLSVQRYVSASGLRPEAEYNLLASFVDQVRSQVAVPMDCVTWVLHQLHGDVTKKAPGAKIHHSEARGCRNFADNSDFSFQLTPYNRQSGLLTVHCTKHRRAPGLEDGAIVRFDGRFGAFRDPDQDYVVDPMTRQIVPRDFVAGSGPFAVSNPGQAPGGFVDPRII